MELSEFLALPYPRILTQDDDGQFIATIAELPGCTADGATEIEALTNLKEIQTIWGEAALKDGREIPLPARADELPTRHGRG